MADGSTGTAPGASGGASPVVPASPRRQDPTPSGTYRAAGQVQRIGDLGRPGAASNRAAAAPAAAMVSDPNVLGYQVVHTLILAPAAGER